MTTWSKPWNTSETVETAAPAPVVETPAVEAPVVEPVVEETKKTTKKTTEAPAE
jgi:hypothetical protein